MNLKPIWESIEKKLLVDGGQAFPGTYRELTNLTAPNGQQITIDQLYLGMSRRMFGVFEILSGMASGLPVSGDKIIVNIDMMVDFAIALTDRALLKLQPPVPPAPPKAEGPESAGNILIPMA